MKRELDTADRKIVDCCRKMQGFRSKVLQTR